ncbi:hypothetical protein ACFLUX_01255 [Chloroflexota bacterium]
MSEQETVGQEATDTKTETHGIVEEEPSGEGQTVKKPEEPLKTPEPTTNGNEKITILKHDIYRKDGEGDGTVARGIELAVKNVSDRIIGCAVFEAILYDIEGNILDTVEHKTIELQPNISRTICITSSRPESDKIKNFYVQIVRTIMTPEPTVTGNEKITILKHGLSQVESDGRIVSPARVEFAIKNVSDITIATAVFEVLFYDREGNILYTVEHKEVDLKPSASRGVVIDCSMPESHFARSYAVKTTRTTTADVEKVQLRQYEIRTTEAGEKEVRGAVKNISEVKTDAALVATFYDAKKENIGTKVMILRSIEPNSIKQYHFTFKPQEGNVVSSSALHIGDIME